MKKLVNTLLIICIVGLIYIVYGSIIGPINFANAKAERDKAVIQKLLNIKAAQHEFHNLRHGGYCDNFDTLAEFIKTAQLPITAKVGELSDDQLDRDWTEQKVLLLYSKARSAEIEAERLTGRRAANKRHEADTLWQRAAKEGFIEILEDGTKKFNFSRETEYVSLYDSLYKGMINPDSLRYVPYTDGIEFELTTSSDTSQTGVISHTFQAQTYYKDYLEGLDKQEIINLLDDCEEHEKFEGLRVDNNSGNWE